ncbi:MAG: DNA-protecting protein DprA, partial [Patescibacteria group bacterium]
SGYGREAVQTIVSGLAGSGLIIVSGLARGIDAAAHETALGAKLKTVAVLGSGMAPAVLFPKENRLLADRIVEAGGAVISEYPFSALPLPWQFPERNRIIAGLSRAVLVVEAREKSGALITANFALEYNRDVLAIPGSIFSENSKGPNALLRAGAAPVFSSLDILGAFGIEYENFAENAYQEVSPIEKKILDSLSSPLSRDELIRQSGLRVQDASSALTLLEMRGIVREAGGAIMKVK